MGRLTLLLGTPEPVPDEPLAPALETLRALYETIVGRLPLIIVAFVIALLALVLFRLLERATRHGLARTRADRVAISLVSRLVRLLGVVAAVLLALTILGVPVGPALAGLGLAGLAVAFALQAILENLVAGLILMIRKPFRAGDQIETNEYQGTVEEIDLRVTRLVDFDGRTVLVPNVDVYTNPVINLTRRGKRRSVLTVGVDYRDDHDAAREVIRTAIAGVDGVLTDPPPEALLTELGDSSVDFELWYWTLPDNATVRRTQDRVLAAVKRAIEDAGMTIPWPIRTLVVDGPVAVRDDQRA